MKLFEFGRSTQGFLGHIELPAKAIGIPYRQVNKWLQLELALTMEGAWVGE
jgi:hypothetical protein